MTTSELLRAAADEIDNPRMRTNRELIRSLLQEADRLEGLELVAWTPDSAKGITLGQGFGKPKPEKLEAFSGGIVPVEKFEEVLINKEHMYGGTADAIAKVNGKTCLIDFKTSSAVYPEHYIQVAAYEVCLPEVEDCYILHLDKDTNGWELLHAKTEGLFDVFLAAKKIYDFIRNK